MIYRRLWEVMGVLVLTLLATVAAIAQTKTQAVKGIVQSTEGIALQGVTITLQNADKSVTKVTLSDDKGLFTFDRLKPGGPYSFIFSSVGYEKNVLNGYSYSAGDIITLSVVLRQQNKRLEDVVVVGYGTERKANLTGAVDQVGTQYFDDRPMPNITRGLEGAIANLNISVTDGKPTASSVYNIRGTTSIGAGATQGALVLIDGVPGDPTGLNPADIASVTVLKDAASSTIYGARGAFGIVLITTRSPEKDKIAINYNPSFGLMARTVVPKLVTNGYQYAVLFDSAYTAWYDYLSQPSNINTVIPFSLAYLDSLRVHNQHPGLPQVTVDPSTGAYQYFGNTDWEKALYASADPMTEQALSLSGGSDKIGFLVSGRYYSQGGLFRQNTDKFERYNLRVKGSIKVAKWLTINTNTDFSAFRYKYPFNSISKTNIWEEIANAAPPVAVMRNPDGTLTQSAAYGLGGLFDGNSYSLTKQYFIRNTLGFAADILPGRLVLNGDFSYLYTSTGIVSQLYPVSFSTAPGQITTSPYNSLSNKDSLENYYAANLYAQYHRYIRAHSIALTVGANLESDLVRKDSIAKTGLIVSNPSDLNLAAGSVTAADGGGSQWATVGLFYRANYAYADKYLLELDGRYDGSSKFPTGQQFGFFPSVSAGWRLNREPFLRGARNWLDNWKVRASYGSLGNGQISPYLFLPLIQSGTTTTIVGGNYVNYLAGPNVIPAGLTWERSTTMDGGMDIDVLHRRLTVNADWYQRRTTGMITQSVPLPSVFGAPTPNGNNANLKTNGWEISLNWNDQVKMHKPLTYGVRLTLSNYVSHITRFNNPDGSLTTYYTGERLGDIWGFVTDGFFTSPQDIAAHASQRNYVSVSNDNIVLPGDIKFKDLNGDGVINNGANTLGNPGDQKVIGNASPRYLYGVTPFVSWNNFSLSTFFQGVGKQNWWPGNDASFFWGQYNRPYNLIPVSTLSHWQPDDPNGYFPRYRGYVALSGTRELSLVQTRYLQNAAYIRLKNLTAAYCLPRTTLERLHVTALKIYFTCQNIWTYSALYKHTRAYDPEVLGADPSGGLGGGNDYPILKSYVLGLNLTF